MRTTALCNPTFKPRGASRRFPESLACGSAPRPSRFLHPTRALQPWMALAVAAVAAAWAMAAPPPLTEKGGDSGWVLDIADPVTGAGRGDLSKSHPDEATQLPAPLGAPVLSVPLGLLTTPTDITPEITSLARALKHDPRRIFDYVHNRIDYVPTYGAILGATATYYAGRGNDCDQSSLFVALMRASGYEAKFQYGYVFYYNEDLANWVGTEPWMAQTMLGRGGIPIDSYSLGAWVLRVWAIAFVEGAWVHFDPAMKPYAKTAPIIADLPAVLGYTPSNFIARAQSGGTATNDYVQNLNTDNIRGDLTAFSTNLIEHLREHHPTAAFEDVVGGYRIIETEMEAYPTSLPFAVAVENDVYTWTVNPPTSFRQFIYVQHAETGSYIQLYTCQFAGRRMTIFHDGTNSVMAVDGTRYLTFSNTPTNSGFTVRIIVDPVSEIFSWKEHYFPLVSGMSYAIVHDFDGVSPASIAARNTMLSQTGHAGADPASEAVRGEALSLLGQEWCRQLGLVERMTDQINNVRTVPLHRIGIVGQGASFYIDMQMLFVTACSRDGQSNLYISYKAQNMLASALEHGAIRQLQNHETIDAVSTIRLLDLCNSEGKALYQANSNNWLTGSVVRNVLTNYSASMLASFDALINSGYDLVLPQDGLQQLGDWDGVGYIRHLDYGTGMNIGMFIRQYAGGYTANPAELDPSVPEWANSAYSPIDPDAPESNDPVDMFSGAFLFEHTDLNVGPGAGPRGLKLARSYSSAGHYSPGPLGHGWTHDNRQSAVTHSSGPGGLGSGGAVNAAAAIAYSIVALDLLKDEQLEILNWATTVIATKWAMDQLIGNAVTVHDGTGATTFLKLPDGSYNPPPGKAGRLNVGEAGFLLEEPFGALRAFDAAGRLATVRDANGNEAHYAYDHESRLAAVTNAFGKVLAFTYDEAGYLTSVSHGGRSVQYSYADGNLVNFKDAAGVDWGYVYDAENRLTEVRKAAPAAVAQVSNIYDAFGRVETQTDALGNVSHLFFSGCRNIEAFPDDGEVVTVFDRNGRFIAREDPLGERTTYAYNGVGQLIRITDRGGAVSRMAYHPGTGQLAALTNANGGVTTWTYAPRDETPWCFNRIRDAYPDGTCETYTHDECGNVLTRTDRAGGVWTQTYNSRGQALTLTRPGGGTQTFTYNPDGTLASESDSETGTTSYSYDLFGRKIGVLHSDGATESWAYDALDRIISHVNAAGGATTYAYDANGVQTSVTDPLGHVVSEMPDWMGRITNRVDGLGLLAATTYDAMGRITLEADPAGSTQTAYDLRGGATNVLRGSRATHFAHDANAHITNRVTARGHRFAVDYSPMAKPVVFREPGGSQRQLAYDRMERTVLLRDPLGRETIYGYDAAGRQTAMTNALGGVSTRGYDADGNLILARDEAGNTTAYAYTPMGRLAGETNALGQTTRRSYDSRGRLIRVEHPDGTCLETRYDSAGRLHTRRDEGSNVWIYAYDARGAVLSVTNPVHGVFAYAYTPDGRLARVADSDGVIVSNRYDAARRLSGTASPDGSSTAHEYNEHHERTAFTDARGHTTRYAYDADGRLSRVTDPAGYSLDYATDALGRVTNIIDRVGGRTVYAYDQAGRLAAVTDPTGVPTVFGRDALGRMISRTIGTSVWHMAYNNVGTVTNVTLPSGRCLAKVPDALQHIVRSINAAGETTSIERDARGRTTAVTDPGGRITRYRQDPRGLLAGVTLPDGSEAEYVWDALGNLSRVTDCNDADWTFAYTPMGRLRSLTDPLGRLTQYGYDANGRMVSTTWPDGGTAVHTRDANGDITRTLYSDGLDLSWQRDALGRVTNANSLALAYDAEGRSVGATAAGMTFGATRDAAGRLASATYANSAFAVSYTYATGPDGDGRLTRVQDSLTGTQIDFTYDADRRLSVIALPNGETIRYTWDAADRLIRVESGRHVDVALTRDLAGRITRQAVTAPLTASGQLSSNTVAFSYDAASQIDAAGFAHDARGRMTNLPAGPHPAALALAWDGASRLTEINDITLAYDAMGQLIGRAAGGVTNRFHHLHAIDLVPVAAEQDAATGEMLRYYVWTPNGRLLYMIDAVNGNRVRFYHFDPNGSTLALTDGEGDVTDAYAYDPYGRVLASSGDSPQPFTFVGAWGARQAGADGALYQMRARWYDAALGRFLTPEPVWPQLIEPKSLNPYQYAGADPIGFIDPTGLAATRDSTYVNAHLTPSGRQAAPMTAGGQSSAAAASFSSAAWSGGSIGDSYGTFIPSGASKPLGITRVSIPSGGPQFQPPGARPDAPEPEQNDLGQIIFDQAVDYAIDEAKGRVEDWVKDKAIEAAQREIARKIGEEAAEKLVKSLMAKANAAGVLIEGAQAAAQLWQWANMDPAERYQSMSQELSFQVVDAMVNQGGVMRDAVRAVGGLVSWFMGD